MAASLLTAALAWQASLRVGGVAPHDRRAASPFAQLGRRGDADQVREAAAREAAERNASERDSFDDSTDNAGGGGSWADWSSDEDLDVSDELSWAADEDAGIPQAPWIAPALAVPNQPRRPIEAVKIGRVSGPYTRRNGYHVDVRVQHDGEMADETQHTLWISHQALDEISLLRGKEEYEVPVAAFSEAVVAFLGGEGGVDLLDPDWEIDNPDVPFSSQHASVRTLVNYYPQLKEHLAEALFGPDTGAKRSPPFKNMEMGSHPLSGW